MYVCLIGFGLASGSQTMHKVIKNYDKLMNVLKHKCNKLIKVLCFITPEDEDKIFNVTSD